MKDRRAWRGAGLAACGLATSLACRPPTVATSQLSEADDHVASDDSLDGLKQALIAEVLEGYERGNDPFEAALGDYYGFGLGPDDLWSAPEAFVMMPLAVEGRAVSNRLASAMSKSGTSAWISDEVSWRADVCGRQLPIPLRFTAVLRRDGERWYPLMQHVSLAARSIDGMDAADLDAAKRAVANRSGPERDVLPADAAAILTTAARRADELLVVGPMAGAAPFLAPSEARAVLEVLASGQVVQGADQSAFVAPTGPDDGGAVGYWAGIVVVDAAAVQRALAGDAAAPLSSPGSASGELQLRVTVVLTQSERDWLPVHVHVSAAIGHDAMAKRIFGTQIASLSPLEFSCD